MKKLTIPIIVIIGFLASVYAVLRLKYHTTEICLFGAGYAALLMAIYALIVATIGVLVRRLMVKSTTK